MIQITPPQRKINATIHLRGSKSLSNRWLVLKHILKSDTVITNLSDSDDTQFLIEALRQIKNKNKATIHVGHAGTDMRFLTALLAVTPGQWIVTGSEELKKRPIGDLVKALNSLGADIHFAGSPGFPPLAINGRELEGGKVSIAGNISSQFISALLLITPLLKNGIEISITGNIVSRPYIDMTIELLREVGMNIISQKNIIAVVQSAGFSMPSTVVIESDWSSASYWYSICALSKQAIIRLTAFNERSFQADAILPLLFNKLGVATGIKDNTLILTKQHTQPGKFGYNFTECPDIAQTLAVTCFGLGVEASLSGLSTLMIKETNRLVALKTELENLGAAVRVTDDTLHVSGKPATHSYAVNTYHDHRMAMSFAPLAFATGSVCINDEQVVSKSYPAYWSDLLSVGFNVNLQPS